MRRVDNISFATQELNKIDRDDNCYEAIVKVDQKLSYIKSMFRSEDDQLITILFQSQSTWHDTTVQLNETLKKLNSRINELEKLIRDKE